MMGGLPAKAVHSSPPEAHAGAHLRIIWLISCGPSRLTCMPFTRLMAIASRLVCARVGWEQGWAVAWGCALCCGRTAY